MGWVRPYIVALSHGSARLWPRLAALALLAGAALAAAQGAPGEALRTPVRQLDQAEVLASDAGAPARLDPGAAWRPQALPDDWALTRPAHGGSLWYRFTFDGDGLRMAEDVPAVYIGRACSNVAVFLNGVAVGSGGRMQPPYTRNCFVPQLFPLPQASLLAGTNVLHLQVVGYPLGQIAAAQRSSGLADVRLGPLRELQPLHADATFWRVTLARITATILVSFCLLFGALWLMRRQDSFYGWFALWIGWWGVNAMRTFITDPVVPSPWIERMVVVTTPLAMAGLILFKVRYAGLRPRWLDGLLLAQALLVPGLVLALGPDRLNAFARVFYLVALAEYLAVSVWFALRAWRLSRRDFWMFIGGDLLLVLLGVVEFSAGYLGLSLKVQLAPLAGPITLLPMSLRLLWLLAESLSRSEQLNAELEHRVAEKTAEIARSYAELADLRAREAAQRERQRIASDLHDDLGAQLLSIAHASEAAPDEGRVAGMARQALDEMRLSVRGMVSEPTAAAEALADWRAETVTRLQAGGFEVRWEADEPPAGLVLPARTHMQLTRILREAVSNVLRHSGGRHCRLHLVFVAPGLHLTVEDDGRGLEPGAARGRGLGLANIERRARKLGGTHAFSRSALGGARLDVVVPLDAVASDNMPLHALRPDR